MKMSDEIRKARAERAASGPQAPPMRTRIRGVHPGIAIPMMMLVMFMMGFFLGFKAHG